MSKVFSKYNPKSFNACNKKNAYLHTEILDLLCFHPRSGNEQNIVGPHSPATTYPLIKPDRPFMMQWYCNNHSRFHFLPKKLQKLNSLSISSPLSLAAPKRSVNFYILRLSLTVIGEVQSDLLRRRKTGSVDRSSCHLGMYNKNKAASAAVGASTASYTACTLL